MINSSTLVGNLTKDIELRYSQSGKAVANFTVAVSRPFKNQEGNRETDFINCVQFGKGAELLSQYTGKGSKVGVTGRIQTRNFEGQDGKRVYMTEVVADQVAFLDPKKDNAMNQQQADNLANNLDAEEVSNKDLPF